jgi:hypothetical protein
MRPACQPPPIRDKKTESRHSRRGEGFFSKLLEAISYAYKSVFMRRSTYTDDDGKTQTRAYPLKGPDYRELLQFLAKYKVGSRAILRGVRRNGKLFVLTNKG